MYKTRKKLRYENKFTCSRTGAFDDQGGKKEPNDDNKLDPSGIVYFEDTGLPAGQVKMMIYVSKSADGADAFAWVNQGEEGDAGDAAYAEIRRPSEWDEPGVQMTDHSGYYQ